MDKCHEYQQVPYWGRKSGLQKLCLLHMHLNKPITPKIWYLWVTTWTNTPVCLWRRSVSIILRFINSAAWYDMPINPFFLFFLVDGTSLASNG